MTAISRTFVCPLRGPCFSDATPFPCLEEANQAVEEYHRIPDGADRDRRAAELFERFLPLVRKSLRQFCHPFRPNSGCYPGACLPEDLVGETYPIFRDVLEGYDSSRGVDFVGFALQQFYWGLEHRVRPMERVAARQAPWGDRDYAVWDDEEERLFRRILTAELLERLEPEDADLITRDAAGHTSEEMGRVAGISPAAVRKRLERIRRRLRALAGED